jgi:hypothetical protein
MAFLAPLAGALLPGILGPIMHKIVGDGMDNPKQLLLNKQSGKGLIGGRRKSRRCGSGLIGGRRVRRVGNGLTFDRRRLNPKYRGKGFGDTLKKIAQKVFHYGKKAHALYNNKAIRGLIHHGINTYKHISEKGLGRKRQTRIKYMMNRRIRGGAIESPPGPLA